MVEGKRAMSNIVERLRKGEPCLEACGDRCKEMSVRGGCLCAIAADEIERLRAALEAWNAAVRKDVLMEGPRYMGVDLTRGRDAWELTKAILKETSDE